MDIVQTEVNGKRVAFALDAATHLPIRFIVYGLVNGFETPTVVTDLSDYVEVQGIKAPRKITPEKGSTIRAEIQVNVDYNEEIFLKQTTIEAGPEAWKKLSGRT